jgi:hypothetical protein
MSNMSRFTLGLAVRSQHELPGTMVLLSQLLVLMIHHFGLHLMPLVLHAATETVLRSRGFFAASFACAKLWFMR